MSKMRRLRKSVKYHYNSLTQYRQNIGISKQINGQFKI